MHFSLFENKGGAGILGIRGCADQSGNVFEEIF